MFEGAECAEKCGVDLAAPEWKIEGEEMRRN